MILAAAPEYAPYWIGGIPDGIAADGKQIWKWSNGDKFMYTNLMSSYGGEDDAFISLDGGIGSWMISHSWLKQFYICSKNVMQVETEGTVHTKHNSIKTYRYINPLKKLYNGSKIHYS